MYTHNNLLEIIEKHLNEMPMAESPRHLYEPIRYTLAEGGKRIRPVTTLMACNMFSDDVEVAVCPALAIELFHTFTLVHDDIVDRAEMRRGRATVNKKWNDSIAIISGDATLVLAYEMLRQTKTDRLSELMNVFNNMALGVCEGQQYDMDFETQESVSVEEYLKMIELKTSMLLAGGLTMGAVVGGASHEDSQKLFDFGVNLGIAFQLQDDLLDTYGDPITFGKNIGGDILTGKRTYLLINVLKSVDGSMKDELHDLLNFKHIIPKIKIERMKRIFDAMGVQEKTEEAITLYFNKALEILDSIDVPAERRAPLRDLAYQLMKRNK